MGSRLTHHAKSVRTERTHTVRTDPEQLDLALPASWPMRRAEAPRMDHVDQPSDDSALPPRTGGRPGHTAVLALLSVGALALTATPAWAAGAGATMPWDAPLTRLVDNLSGTTARLLVTVAVVAAGLLWAFTRNEEGMKRLGQIAFGGAIALGAVTLMGNLGFAGASF